MDKTISLAFLKKNPESLVEAGTRTIASQLHVINLGDSSPFDTLHNYIHNSFAPLFRSIVNKSQKKGAEKEGKIGKCATHMKVLLILN